MPTILLSAIAAASLSLGTNAGLSPTPAPAEGSAQPAVQPEGPQPVAEYDPAKDVESVDGIMTALYQCTAGPKGQPRDWDRLRRICHPEARFFATRPDGDGGAAVFTLTVEDYIMHNKSYMEKGGFSESELARTTRSFGHITQVWSTFASRMGDDPDPYIRGIYSVQLLEDKDRWWILSCSWDMERPDNPIPDEYLPAEGE